MSKRSIYTTITPLPAGVTRQVVLETLHTHTEMIDLNPLVEERHPIKPLPQATPEEFHCQWYSLTDRIQYLPGGLYSGKVTYSACFHDLANGVQTHIYAPMGLDIRGCWTIGGSLPGEPQAPVELGKGIPLSGLYLREDTDLKCNIFLMKFVKKNLKNSHSTLVDRLLVKAQLQQAAMNNDGMSDRTAVSHGTSSPHMSFVHPSGSIHGGGVHHSSSLHGSIAGSVHHPSPLSSPGFPAPGHGNLYPDPLSTGRMSAQQAAYAPQGQGQGQHPYNQQKQQYEPRFSPQPYGGSPGYGMDPAYANANPYMQQQGQYASQNQYANHNQYPAQGQYPGQGQGQHPQYDPRMSFAPSELANNNMGNAQLANSIAAANAAKAGAGAGAGQGYETERKKDEKKNGMSPAGPPAYPVPAIELPAEMPS